MSKSYNILSLLFIAVVGVLVLPSISSCGKSDSVGPGGTNVQMQVLNLSTDVLPVDLYIAAGDRVLKKNLSPFYYPNSSGYFSLNLTDTLFQIRSASTTLSAINLITLDTTLQNNLKYSLYVTGLKANNTISYIFTTDTASAPKSGRGKVRFVNATAGINIFNITANGTTVFTNQAYKNVSKYVEMPAGNYDFKIYANTSATTVLSDLSGVTVQDGKLYTLYCRGIVGRTDTAAFGMAVVNNK